MSICFKIAVFFSLCTLVACAISNVTPEKVSGAESIPLTEFVEGLKTVKVVVNGRPLKMIFDTGAGVTVLTPQAANRVGCEIFSEGTGFRSDGTRLDLHTCGPVDVAVGSVATSISAAVGASSESCLLSTDDLAHALERAIRNEFGRQRDPFAYNESASDVARAEGWKELPLRLGREFGGGALDLCRVSVGCTNRLEFDSGSSDLPRAPLRQGLCLEKTRAKSPSR
jgi:hypothetical protein